MPTFVDKVRRGTLEIAAVLLTLQIFIYTQRVFLQEICFRSAK